MASDRWNRNLDAQSSYNEDENARRHIFPYPASLNESVTTDTPVVLKRITLATKKETGG